MGVTSYEAFWNIIFSNAFGPSCVGACFRASQGSMDFGVVYLLSFHSVLWSSIRYSARFNDTDTIHQATWLAYGTGVACMFGCAVPSRVMLAEFAISIAWCKFCVLFLWCRALYHLPDCRAQGRLTVIVLCCNISLWVAVACLELTGTLLWSGLSTWWLVIPALDWVHLKNLVIPASWQLPMSTDFIAKKFSSLNVMMLGVIVVNAFVGLKAHSATVGENGANDRRRAFMIGIGTSVSAILIKVLLQRAENIPLPYHALHVSVTRARVWTILQSMQIFAIVFAGAGISRIISGIHVHEGAQYDIPAQTMMSLGYGGLVAVIGLVDIVHGREFNRIRLLCQIGAAILLALTPMYHMSNMVACMWMSIVTFALTCAVLHTWGSSSKLWAIVSEPTSEHILQLPVRSFDTTLCKV